VGLEGVTTQGLADDLARLHAHLEVGKWLVLGGSWGSTLGLAYAEAHPEQVSGIVLFGVTTSRRCELDWTFRGGLGRFFPAEWQRLVEALPAAQRERDVVAAYARLLADPEPAVHEPAAYEWCLWESAIAAWPPPEGLADRFAEPRFRLCFARQVTHLVAAEAWLRDGALLEGAGALRGIRGVLVNGRLDLQAPLANAWALQRAWPDAELVVVDAVGHTPAPAVERELVRATDAFAADP
jgi:proline iminopeptidase